MKNEASTDSKYPRYNTPYSPQEKLRALKVWEQTGSVALTAHRYHCSEGTLWRWKRQYDGTLKSLDNRSHRPLSPHPNSHSSEEIKHIYDLLRRNPDIGLNELYGKLREYHAYERNYVSLYRLLRKSGYYMERKTERRRYIPKIYDTPEQIGAKWQIDVKFVPRYCHAHGMPEDECFYQYTALDEATRERFVLFSVIATMTQFRQKISF